MPQPPPIVLSPNVMQIAASQQWPVCFNEADLEQLKRSSDRSRDRNRCHKKSMSWHGNVRGKLSTWWGTLFIGKSYTDLSSLGIDPSPTLAIEEGPKKTEEKQRSEKPITQPPRSIPSTESVIFRAIVNYMSGDE